MMGNFTICALAPCVYYSDEMMNEEGCLERLVILLSALHNVCRVMFE